MEIVVHLDGTRPRSVKAHRGALLAHVLRGGGLPLDLPCGGAGRCGRCRVQVRGAVSPPTPEEQAVLPPEELARGLRLACQTRVLGEVWAEAAPGGEMVIQGALGAEKSPAAAPRYAAWGLAADVGTTTLCMGLMGREGLVGEVTRKNPQTAFGADVITRIGHALQGGGADLAAPLQEALGQMAAELAARGGISPGAIDAAVITGNTAMLHLLTQSDPEALSHAPFEAERLFGEPVPSLIPGLAPGADCYLPRCISAFVGADTTMALLAGGVATGEETALLADIGTNGEIALWHKGALYCCSTAAGPAFEGAGISCGSYGVPGAVDKVWVQGGQLRCSAIGGGPGAGICGSGIVDALAAMLALGIIDETGAFRQGNRLELAPGVFVTAEDVRHIQLAKGALRAGMETLLEQVGVDKAQVRRFVIAGGFGSYLNLNSAAAIGLIPGELLPVAVCIGNGALAGAAMVLQNRSLAAAAEQLAKEATTIPLDANPVFMEHYMNHMLF